MYYNGLFGVLEGLEEDHKKIVKIINKMDEESTKSSEGSSNKRVMIGHNGKALYYKLEYGDISYDGYIPFRDIYQMVRGKEEIEYAGTICGLIESHIISQYFN